jgi:hypothetical protein
MSSPRRYANIGHNHVVADISDLDLSPYLTSADLTGYTQASVAETISGAWDFTDTVTFDGADVKLFTNGILRVYNSDDTVNGYLRTADVSSTSPTERLGLRHGPGGALTIQIATIGDDATATFKVPTYGMFFLVNTFNSSAFAHWGLTTTQAPVDFGSGSNVSFGATNPDIDTDVNIWPSSSGVLSIKNRLGSSRTFYLFALGTNEGAT